MTPPQAVLREGIQRLRAAGVGPARQEAEWLLGRLLRVRPLELYLQDEPISPQDLERFRSQLDARAAGVPLQYLLGEAEFAGARFVVTPGVFIPRPETEAIVEAAIEALREQEHMLHRPLRLLDLGTGSGGIAVTLARALPTCVVVGVELTWEALRIAQQNVLRQGLASRVWLVQGHWGQGIGGGFDGVVSNPPYVPRAQVDHLPLDVRQEPRLSLEGGEDGMRELRHLMTQAPRMLREGGLLVLECGEEQVRALMRQASSAPWVKTVIRIDDLAARPRGVLIRRHGG